MQIVCRLINYMASFSKGPSQKLHCFLMCFLQNATVRSASCSVGRLNTHLSKRRPCGGPVATAASWDGKKAHFFRGQESSISLPDFSG